MAGARSGLAGWLSSIFSDIHHNKLSIEVVATSENTTNGDIARSRGSPYQKPHDNSNCLASCRDTKIEREACRRYCASAAEPPSCHYQTSHIVNTCRPSCDGGRRDCKPQERRSGSCASHCPAPPTLSTPASSQTSITTCPFQNPSPS
jgi:hypothetical protein